ncbi:MAG: trypsin-like peptidase domain-containing protein [Bacteroidia bacterium]
MADKQNKGKVLGFDSPSLSTHYLRMIPYGSDITMSTGTGFVYESNSKLYLITNGHNITRVNPETNTRISSSSAFPVIIKTKLKLIPTDNPDALVVSDFFEISLYEDSEYLKPNWLIHPDHGYKVDVIAIPFVDVAELPSHVKLFPINSFYFTEFPLIVADDVFILGYPFDLTGGMELPIWKRGTIATEPSLDLNNLPKMLIDTATRSGMSGAPVLMRRRGIHGLSAKVTGEEIIGLVQQFAGIYSGRIGAAHQFQVQLGIVWKGHVIEEIINGNRMGDIGFQKI